MQQLKRNGIALFYEEAGKGAPPIVLVHGLAGDHTFMTPQFEHFRRTHRVVSVDLRGHGQSEQPQQEYAIAGFAELRCEVTLQHLKFLHPFRRHAFVPLRVWRDQGYRHAVHEHVGATHLAAIYFEIVGRVAAGVIADIADKTGN